MYLLDIIITRILSCILGHIWDIFFDKKYLHLRYLIYPVFNPI